MLKGNKIIYKDYGIRQKADIHYSHFTKLKDVVKENNFRYTEVGRAKTLAGINFYFYMDKRKKVRLVLNRDVPILVEKYKSLKVHKDVVTYEAVKKGITNIHPDHEPSWSVKKYLDFLSSQYEIHGRREPITQWRDEIKKDDELDILRAVL